MGGKRVLISTVGSAGDLFPLVSVAEALRAGGDDVRFAVSRSLGLYIRSLGLPAYAVGDGSEMRVVDDRRSFTNRFDGWAAWRRTVLAYVLPTLAHDVAAVERALDDWSPDVVLASGFSAAARIAAHRAGISLVDVSIYPQMEALASRPARFATAFVAAVEALAGTTSSEVLGRLAWGAPADVLLHDRALLGARLPEVAARGFPAGGGVGGRPEDEATAAAWAATTSTGPKVVVCLGSFVGLAQTEAWQQAIDAVTGVGGSALLVGMRREPAVPADTDRVQAVGFVSLPQLLRAADAVVHHGGIGTTFAALRARCPALVLPQSYDQGTNAELLAAVSAGVDGRRASPASGLRAALGPEVGQGTRTVAEQLVASDDAVAAVLEALSAVAGA